jgi:hypothetical protein
MAVLGHSGSQAPQLMHSSVIIIAMLFLFLVPFPKVCLRQNAAKIQRKLLTYKTG